MPYTEYSQDLRIYRNFSRTEPGAMVVFTQNIAHWPSGNHRHTLNPRDAVSHGVSLPLCHLWVFYLSSSTSGRGRLYAGRIVQSWLVSSPENPRAFGVALSLWPQFSGIASQSGWQHPLLESLNLAYIFIDSSFVSLSSIHPVRINFCL